MGDKSPKAKAKGVKQKDAKTKKDGAEKKASQESSLLAVKKK